MCCWSGAYILAKYSLSHRFIGVLKSINSSQSEAISSHQITGSQEYLRTEAKKRDCEYKYTLNPTEFSIITILTTGCIGILFGFLIIIDPSLQVKMYSTIKTPIAVPEQYFENANYCLGVLAGCAYALGCYCAILASSGGTLESLHLLVNIQGAVQMGLKILLFEGIRYIKTA